jgi:hypothetical protein
LRIDLQLPQKKVACWVSTAYNLGGTRANNLQVHFIVPSILLNQHHILEESFHKHGLTGCAKLWHVSSNHAMFPEGRVFAMIVNHKDVTLLACVVVPTVNLLVRARGDVRA